MIINMIKESLNATISIYVPTESKGKVLSKEEHTEYVKKVMLKMNQLFGGATAQSAMGITISLNGKAIPEKVTIVTSSTLQETLDKNIKEVAAIAIWLRIELEQDAIYVKVNQDAFLV
jgi:hypothetical protein